MLLQEFLFSEAHTERAKLNAKYFTRNRKLNLKNIVTMILNMMRKTLQIEIDSFIENILNKEDLNYTKQAFSKANAEGEPFKCLS
jgi:hypothetical protein